VDMDSLSPSSSFRLSNLYKGDTELQYDLKKQSITDMKMSSLSPSHSKNTSPVQHTGHGHSHGHGLDNDENISPNTKARLNANENGININSMKGLSPHATTSTTSATSPSATSPSTTSARPQHMSKSKPNSPVPPGSFQLELENQSAHFQLNYAEDRQNKLMEENFRLQAALSNAEIRCDKIEQELTSAKQEIVTLKFDKDNLSNEVRKLTRSISAPQESSSGVSVWGQMTAASRELTRVEDELAASVRDLNELRQENESLSRQAEKHAVKEEAHNATVQELLMERKKNEEMAETLAVMMQEKSELSQQLAAQESSLQNEIDARESYCASLRHDLQLKERDIQLLFSEKEFLEGKLEQIKSFGSRDSDISSLTAGTMRSDDSSTKRKRDAEEEDIEEYTETIQMLEEYKNKLFTSESKRRKLLNELQDLRGNVRVFVRCRPFLPSDYTSSNSANDDGELQKCINCNVEGTTVSVSDMTLRGAGQVFQFDKVFDATVQQEAVFTEVSDLIQSSLDGYRVCIFSYGQTGSGKTHTMTGSHQGENRGLISRSVEQIIDRISFMRSTGWTVKATYSMLEVYNETLIDLLASSEKGSSSTKLQISMLNERVVVKNLTEELMESDSLDEGMSQLEEILQRANSMRATASTAMNAESSRSHALFMMNIDAKHEDGTSVQGGLRLVDLAGSERLARTGTQADAARLRETVNINKSLSCLGDVFLGLSKKSAHIPYRNSKLTMLLQVGSLYYIYTTQYSLDYLLLDS
jgi:kinesin family protein C1